MPDDDKQLLALLDEKISYHREQFDRHRAEMERHRLDLARYESSAAPLRGEAIPGLGSKAQRKDGRRRSKGGTSEAIQRVLNGSVPLSVAEITDALLSSGWETSSADPVNNVRTQVNRMVEAARVRKNADGRYELVV